MIKTFGRPLSQQQNPNRLEPTRKPRLDLLEKDEVKAKRPYAGDGCLPSYLVSNIGIFHLHFRLPEFLRSSRRHKNGAAEEANRVLKRILIVGDNELHLRLLNDLLKVHGYEILKTEYGQEAVKLARDNSPDLILMDIKLPDLSISPVLR